MADYLDVLIFSLVGGLLSLLGGLVLLRKQKSAKLLASYSTPFAAGALLAAAFFDLLPEAIEISAAGSAMRWALAGIVLFFLLEHFLHWFHHHREVTEGKLKIAAPLIIIGDSLHNLLDGVAIGAAFLINVPTGIVAAIAVAAHEVPQEIGDFGLLLKAGYGRRKVVLINVASSLLSTVGALFTFWVGSESGLPLGPLLALTAGMFIYIAASDLIPDIHAEAGQRSTFVSALLLISGIVFVGLITEFAHEYLEVGLAAL